jgi:natural product precursor
MKSKKLVLNRETVRSLSVQEMQGVAGGFFSMVSIYVAKSAHCGGGTGTGNGTGTGTGNGTGRCTKKA